MRLHEESGHSRRHRGASEHRHEFTLASRTSALAARHLHRVRGVEHHRAAGTAHHRKRAHVRHEVVVAERGPAFAEHDVGVPGRPRLVRHVGHVPGREELALLDVHGLAATRDGLDEVGLAAQERRSLEHVDHRRDFVERRVLVHVGDDRNARLVAHAFEYSQPGFHSRPPKALVRGPVRLVEGRLVDEPDPASLGNPRERVRRLHRQRLGFDDAGAGNEKQLLVVADLEPAEPHRAGRSSMRNACVAPAPSPGPVRARPGSGLTPRRRRQFARSRPNARPRLRRRCAPDSCSPPRRTR